MTIAVTIIGLVLTIASIRLITKPINRVIKGLNEGADQVTSASGQLSRASQSLAAGAGNQASSLEETSASLEELQAMTKQNADNAESANTLMKETNRVIEQANRTVTDLTVSMQNISSASADSFKIIKTIDEVAFQTNLLALNAAVEAARAGEAGAGFAVVADEVRNLAMRTAEAARNTSNLIEGTVQQVKSGSELVDNVNSAFFRLTENITQVTNRIDEIAGATREQALGIDQISTAVNDVDRITQKNAVNAEESASVAEQLNSQAMLLKNFVNDLVVLMGQHSARMPSKESSSLADDSRPLLT